MKTTLTIIMSVLFLCGCSKKPVVAVVVPGKPAIDFVVSGKDIKFGSVTLHVTKRDGSSLEDIRIVDTTGGQLVTMTAPKATLLPGVNSDVVQVVLHEAHIQKGMQTGDVKGFPVNLVRR
jgi:uncharacterized lipoprotein YajG